MVPRDDVPGDIPAYVLSSPYRTVDLPSLVVIGPHDVHAPGSVLVLRPTRAHTWDQVQVEVEFLERRCMTVSLVLWTDLVSRGDASRMAFGARAIGIQGVVPGPLLAEDLLRTQLADPGAFADQFVRWLGVLGLHVDAEASTMLRAMVSHAPRRLTLRGVLREEGRVLRSWERHFQKQGLGRASHWFAVLGFFGRVFFVVQSEAPGRAAHIAWELGFGDVAALRRRCRDITGVSPTAIQRQLGWKWALHAALVRRGLQPGHAGRQGPPGGGEG